MGAEELPEVLSRVFRAQRREVRIKAPSLATHESLSRPLQPQFAIVRSLLCFRDICVLLVKKQRASAVVLR